MTAPLSGPVRPANLRGAIFQEELTAYAILDAASIDGLLDKLAAEQPAGVCLYPGDREDVAEVAPYLVQLDPDKPFTEWLLANCWGNHWGIFAASDYDFIAMRRHCRKFLKVHTEDGKPLWFRYYDPRVLRVFLHTCSPDELSEFFGKIHCFTLEGEQGELVQYRVGPATLQRYTPS